MNTRALSPGLKRLGREADHLHSSTSETKNVWNYTSTPFTCLHGKRSDDLAVIWPAAKLHENPCELCLKVKGNEPEEIIGIMVRKLNTSQTSLQNFEFILVSYVGHLESKERLRIQPAS